MARRTVGICCGRVERIIFNMTPPQAKDIRILEVQAQKEDGDVLFRGSTKEEAIRKIKRHASPSDYSVEDIMYVAMKLPKDRYPIGALLLQWVSFDYLRELDLSKGLELLHGLIHDVQCVILTLNKCCYVKNNEERREFVDRYGIALLREILRWLRYQHRDNDIIRCQVKCTVALCSISNELGLPDEVLKYGVEIFQDQLQGNSKNCKYFGMLHYEIGLAFYNLGESSRSVESYSAALQAFEKAHDIYEDERSDWRKKVRSARERADRESSNPHVGLTPDS